ncbi:MAG: hypothetical protein JWM75_866 [Sphingomonas bacterium]|nr:hypothetical protein [Sphingomonas bacterium]
MASLAPATRRGRQTPVADPRHPNAPARVTPRYGRRLPRCCRRPGPTDRRRGHGLSAQIEVERGAGVDRLVARQVHVASPGEGEPDVQRQDDVGRVELRHLRLEAVAREIQRHALAALVAVAEQRFASVARARAASWPSEGICCCAHSASPVMRAAMAAGGLSRCQRRASRQAADQSRIRFSAQAALMASRNRRGVRNQCGRHIRMPRRTSTVQPGASQVRSGRGRRFMS